MRKNMVKGLVIIFSGEVVGGVWRARINSHISNAVSKSMAHNSAKEVGIAVSEDCIAAIAMMSSYFRTCLEFIWRNYTLF